MLAFIGFIIYGSLVPLTYRYVPLEEAWTRYVQAFSQQVEVDNRGAIGWRTSCSSSRWDLSPWAGAAWTEAGPIRS